MTFNVHWRYKRSNDGDSITFISRSILIDDIGVLATMSMTPLTYMSVQHKMTLTAHLPTGFKLRESVKQALFMPKSVGLD